MRADEQQEVPHWEGDVVEFLRSIVALKDAVAGQFYPMVAAEGAKFPYLCHQEITTNSETTHSGPQNYDNVLYQFTVWSKSWTRARDLRKVLREAIEGETLPGPFGVSVTFSNQYAIWDPEAKAHGAILEVRLHLNPAAA